MTGHFLPSLIFQKKVNNNDSTEWRSKLMSKAKQKGPFNWSAGALLRFEVVIS